MKKTYLAIALAVTTFFACNTGGNSSNTADSTTQFSDSSDNAVSGTMGSDTSASAMNAGSTTVNDMDKQFMIDAAGGGNTEVEASQVALNTSTNDRVKSFANMMINDHTKANNELKALANRKSVTVPDSAAPEKRDALQSLKKMSGAGFDKQYMTQMVKDHQETINKFQMATQKCEDSDLKTWAAGKLPALKMHLDSAQAIQKSLK